MRHRPGTARKKRGRQKYPPPEWIFIDVDGTLTPRVIEWIRQIREGGYRFVLWSMRGEDYARLVAERFEAADLFDHIISKPGFIVDDQGWNWIRYTRILQTPFYEHNEDPMAEIETGLEEMRNVSVNHQS